MNRFTLTVLMVFAASAHGKIQLDEKDSSILLGLGTSKGSMVTSPMQVNQKQGTVTLGSRIVPATIIELEYVSKNGTMTIVCSKSFVPAIGILQPTCTFSSPMEAADVLDVEINDSSEANAISKLFSPCAGPALAGQLLCFQSHENTGRPESRLLVTCNHNGASVTSCRFQGLTN